MSRKKVYGAAMVASQSFCSQNVVTIFHSIAGCVFERGVGSSYARPIKITMASEQKMKHIVL